jgi:hypothetical protein
VTTFVLRTAVVVGPVGQWAILGFWSHAGYLACHLDKLAFHLNSVTPYEIGYGKMYSRKTDFEFILTKPIFYAKIRI